MTTERTPAEPHQQGVPAASAYTEQAEQRGAEKALSVERIAAVPFSIKSVYWPTGEPGLTQAATRIRDALLSDSEGAKKP
jgi:hypothetical protein